MKKELAVKTLPDGNTFGLLQDKSAPHQLQDYYTLSARIFQPQRADQALLSVNDLPVFRPTDIRVGGLP